MVTIGVGAGDAAVFVAILLRMVVCAIEHDGRRRRASGVVGARSASAPREPAVAEAPEVAHVDVTVGRRVHRERTGGGAEALIRRLGAVTRSDDATVSVG